MQRQRLSWLALTLAVLGCASPAATSGTPAAADTHAVEVAAADGTADQAATDAPGDGAPATAPDTAPVAADAAPAVPCGNQKGKVICDVGLHGYIRNESSGLASAAPYVDGFFLSEALAKVTQPYAIVFIGAWW